MAATPDEPDLHPLLIVVSGQAGSGKTTLAHQLAQSIGCPAICRDEIKEGMVHAHGPGFEAETSDPLTAKTYPLFFDLLGTLLAAGVTTVAEAAFQHRLWDRGLAPLRELAPIRVVRCQTDGQVMLQRRRQRMAAVATRGAHADNEWPELMPDWDAIQIDAPTLDVDTTDGYRPSLAEIAAFTGSHPDSPTSG